MDHRDPRPCGSPVSSALYPEGIGRQDRRRRQDHGCAGNVWQNLQRRDRVPAGRFAVRCSFSRMVIPTGSATWTPSPCIRRGIRPPAWFMSSAMRPLRGTRFSCRMAARHGPIFLVAMRRPFTTPSMKVLSLPDTCACSCATTMARMAVTSLGNHGW